MRRTPKLAVQWHALPVSLRQYKFRTAHTEASLAITRIGIQFHANALPQALPLRRSVSLVALMFSLSVRTDAS
jgi:hypothetical protein